MTGHQWKVQDMVTGETFQYKRYAPSGAYYMKRGTESKFTRVKRVELFKSLTKAHVRGGE